MTRFSFYEGVHSLAFAVGALNQTVRLIGRNVTAIAADAAYLDFIDRCRFSSRN